MNYKDFSMASLSSIINSESRVNHLLEQKLRVENAVRNNDPALTLDTSKALLETTFKTILSDKLDNPNLEQDLNPLYKTVRDNLALNRNREANADLTKLTNTIVNFTGVLRNKYGAASHGNDGQYTSPIEMPEAEMVARFSDSLSGFLFTKHKQSIDPAYSKRIYYFDYEEFNEYLDSSNEPMDLKIDSAKPVPYSKFLYDYEQEAYKEFLIQFTNQKKEDEIEEMESIIMEEPYVQTNDSIINDTSSSSSLFFTKSEWNIIEYDLLLTLLSKNGIQNFNYLPISEEIIKRIESSKIIDWQKSESSIAKMRNVVKVVLRENSYPEESREKVIEKIFIKIEEST